MKGSTEHDSRARVRIVIRGAVQGVGFRPFVFRLAEELGVDGWVSNTTQGVVIEAEGSPRLLEALLLRIEREKPSPAFIQSLEPCLLDPVGYAGFEIRESREGEKTALVLPDIATCPECLREIFDREDRRYRYPFTNCTHCGPRYTIIEALPYDRPNTSMKGFDMCPVCRAEYEEPRDRRFHAQPTACPACGPRLALWAPDGEVLAERHEALQEVVAATARGRIAAVKGLGGFHLMVDASNQDAVRRLRQRKLREEKPLALMYPSIEQVREDCEVSELEERLLLSRESPIVLLQSRHARRIAPNVAPGNPYLGVMLPYTPLHHMLMRAAGCPLVATSGNLTDEPICTDERDALERLSGIADLFLVHDRPIVRHVDDSIVRVVLGRELVLRRARGYAPLPVLVDNELPSVLAVGAHLKNTVAMTVGRSVFVSQHIGDLHTPQALDAFRHVMDSFERLWDRHPEMIACDLHPDYASTRYALAAGKPVIPVQHHDAHVLSCIAENDLPTPVLGISWDGTGYGPDGTVWGGEFLMVTRDGFGRVAHLRTFRLPGGEKAVSEPRRAALGLLYECFGEDLLEMTELEPLREFGHQERNLLVSMLRQGFHAPLTSSAGRLFDAVAALVGLRQASSFEGQAAMELEFSLAGTCTDSSYDLGLHVEESEGLPSVTIVDWKPMVLELLEDVRAKQPVAHISARFHNTLVEMMIAVARRAETRRVALTGGCFQNVYLLTRAVRRLREEGFHPYWHQRIPPNDGGIALGQVMATLRQRAATPDSAR
jgi:hydrogenase maturation protein HypF